VGMNADVAKQEIRERVWAKLDHEHAVDPPGAHGTIPKFVGSDAAARRLATLPEWKAANVVKANPDRAQLPVRAQALIEEKLLYMAVPKIATLRPFYLLDPRELSSSPVQAATSAAASVEAPTVGVDELRPIDMFICGSVAVNRYGTRVGKGAGYSDIEAALLIEAGLIGNHTTIVTTVHSLQLVDGSLPETEHDFSVDLIITPDQVIKCPPSRRPSGLVWEHLGEEKIAAIPALAARASRPRDGREI
jgi:5-formyltetrahydrofolate cyclo-ligase